MTNRMEYYLSIGENYILIQTLTLRDVYEKLWNDEKCQSNIYGMFLYCKEQFIYVCKCIYFKK